MGMRQASTQGVGGAGCAIAIPAVRFYPQSTLPTAPVIHNPKSSSGVWAQGYWSLDSPEAFRLPKPQKLDCRDRWFGTRKVPHRMPTGKLVSSLRAGARPEAGSMLHELDVLNAQLFRGGIVFKAHRLCITQVWLENNKEEAGARRTSTSGLATRSVAAVVCPP